MKGMDGLQEVAIQAEEIHQLAPPPPLVLGAIGEATSRMVEGGGGGRRTTHNPMAILKGIIIPTTTVPKPAALKILEGRPSRQIQNEVQPKGKPKRPRGLSTIEAKHWNYNIPKLVELGIATDLDQNALESMVRWWGLYSEAMEARNVNAAQKSFNAWFKIAGTFGMMPAERSKLAHIGKPADEQSTAAQFLA